MIVFFDFEVTKYDWLVVLIEPLSEKETVIVNDPVKLESFYNDHKSDIWIGYNNRSYDNYILKGILCGFNPKDINDHIIVKKRQGWQFSSALKGIQLYSYDCFTDKRFGLKQLEAFMGDDIRETSTPFDIDRKLTDEEITDMIKYCKHDVEETMKVFNHRINEWNTQLQVLTAFKLPIHNISKTQTQLSATALGAIQKERYDEWEYSLVDTIKLDKYSYVKDWYLDPDNHDYKKSLITNVCGIPHIFAWGGLHGACGHIEQKKDGSLVVIGEPTHRKGLIIHVDVTSFYPSIMIRYDMLSRNVQDKNTYKEIYDTRVALKKAGKKKQQEPYKLILNKTYGGSGDQYSALCDMRRRNEVCINGQLLLCDLCEKLEGYCELLQSNTDGLIIQIPDTDEAFEKIDDICFEWEQRTGMGLGFDFIKEIFQKDVNNYLWIDFDDNVHAIGGYVKPFNILDNDLPIVKKALVDYMVKRIPPESTINDCDDLTMFQKVVKVSSKYEYGLHNSKKLNDKTFRVFASNDVNDTAIYKVKNKNGVLKPEKFANTPLCCFIDNSDIKGKQIPSKLDRSWYVEMSKKRLEQFGVII